MHKLTFINVLKQAKKPSRFYVILKKVLKKIYDAQGRHTEIQNIQWLKSNSSDFELVAIDIDKKLWEESIEVSNFIDQKSGEKLKEISVTLGGGGIYPFLYFITRLLKPENIVETGVGAGFSSQAFLLGIEKNQHGRLYSSDFPYFRLDNPEKYIGVLVDDDLKRNWDLYIEGDEINLTKILNKIDSVELFHYDSDKTYSGREKAMKTILPYVSKKGVVLMDDIQDNSFFYDYVEEIKPSEWYVFKFNSKYVGLIGNLTSR